MRFSLLVLSVLPACGAPTLLFETSSPRVLDRAITVGKEEFTPARIRDLARQFVKEEGAHFVLARLTIGLDAADVGRAVTLVRSEVTYESSVENIRTSGLPEAPLARVVVFNGAAVLWRREGRTIATERLAGDADGIVLEEGATKFELLHFHLVDSRAPATPNDRYHLDIFLRAQPAISISACTAVTRTVRELTAVGWLTAYVREDIWFLDNGEYPDAPPFADRVNVPTKREFLVAPNVVCNDDWRHPMKCRGVSFVP